MADMNIRSLALLRDTGRSVLNHSYSQVAARGVDLAIAIREMVDPSDAPKPEKCDFLEVGGPAGLAQSRSGAA